MIDFNETLINGNEYDVMVIGGGTAGWIAALAAARQGKKTIIIEKKGYVGGALTTGMPINGFHDGNMKHVVKGLADEFVQRMVKTGQCDGYHLTDLWFNSFVNMNAAIVKPIIFEMLYEAGVEIKLFSQVIDVIMDGNQVKGVLVQDKLNKQIYLSKVCIDASGDAHVAYLAGAEMQEVDANPQPPTLLFRIENVDMDKLRKYLCEHPENYLSFRMKPGKKLTKEFLEDTPFFFIFPDKIKDINYCGDYMPLIDRYMFSIMPGTNGVIVNMLRARKTDCTSSDDLTKATIVNYRNLLAVMDGFKNNIPGFENAYLCDAEPEIQIRETRRIVGEYTLTEEDITQGKSFEDSIAVGGYFIDIHSCNDSHGRWERTEKGYGIPYRTLVSKNIDSLIVTGRAISGTQVAAASFRVMATCMGLGEAAGIAAAICCDKNQQPRDIDTNLLRYILAKNNAVID